MCLRCQKHGLSLTENRGWWSLAESSHGLTPTRSGVFIRVLAGETAENVGRNWRGHSQIQSLRRTSGEYPEFRVCLKAIGPYTVAYTALANRKVKYNCLLCRVSLFWCKWPFWTDLQDAHCSMYYIYFHYSNSAGEAPCGSLEKRQFSRTNTFPKPSHEFWLTTQLCTQPVLHNSFLKHSGQRVNRLLGFYTATEPEYWSYHLWIFKLLCSQEPTAWSVQVASHCGPRAHIE